MRRVLAGLLAAGALCVLPVAPAVAQAPGCDVGSATLEWGFKESFRAYIDGSIANGEWTVADGAGYDTPSFVFPGGSGRIDPRDPNGSLGFTGSVRFTGHGGVLDTTVANPILVIRPDGTGLLLLDVSGPTMAGDSISVVEAAFLDVDLEGQDLTPVDGVVTIDAAPTTLTAEGSEAFPDYPAGEEFDPLSVTADVGDCDLAGHPIGTDVLDREPEPSAALLAVPAGALAIAAGLVVVIARRRRRR